MKLYREQTLTFHAKKGDGPWEYHQIPVLELREGPWWAFLQERLFRCASAKITTHYVRGYKKERYLQIAHADDVNEYLASVSVFNKKLTDKEMQRLTQVESKPYDTRWIPPDQKEEN